MKGFEINKILASILVALIIIHLSATIADLLYWPAIENTQRGYIVIADDISEDNQVENKQEDFSKIEELMKQANASNGKVIFKKCLSCHTYNKDGHNKIGPNLYNIVGRKKAFIKDFSYSKALTMKGGLWNLDSLAHFLHKPKNFLPGTKMAFVGLKKLNDIADLIAFLLLNSDNPIKK